MRKMKTAGWCLVLAAAAVAASFAIEYMTRAAAPERHA